MPNDKRLTDQQFNSLIARKSMKPKTYGKTKPRQERIVDIRNMTDKSSILNRKFKFGSQNVLKPDIWSPQAPKIALGGT